MTEGGSLMLVTIAVLCLQTVAAEFPSLPEPDGKLNVFSLPVGQGDAQIIQWPNGDIMIADMGSLSRKDTFWHAAEIRAYIGPLLSQIKYILITHFDPEQYNLLPKVFNDDDIQNMTSLKGVIISETWGQMLLTPRLFKLTKFIKKLVKVQSACIWEINEGRPCIINTRNTTECKMNVARLNAGTCSNAQPDPALFSVLAANHGGVIDSLNSIMLKIVYDEFSILLPGGMNQERVMSHMADSNSRIDLASTVYKLPGHGSSLVNNKLWNDAIQPNAIYSTGDPINNHFLFPHCETIRTFVQDVGSLCKGHGGQNCPNHMPELFSSNFCGVGKMAVPYDNSDEYFVFSNIPYVDASNQPYLALLKISSEGGKKDWDIEFEQVFKLD